MFKDLDSSPQARILRARVVKASVDKKARGKTRRTLYQEEGVPDQDARLEQTLRQYPRDFFVFAPDSTPDPVFRRESPVFEPDPVSRPESPVFQPAVYEIATHESAIATPQENPVSIKSIQQLAMADPALPDPIVVDRERGAAIRYRTAE